MPNSAAEESGLRVDDIIVAVDAETIGSASELRNAIGLRGFGESVEITYNRDGETFTTSAVLGKVEVATSAGDDLHEGLQGAQFATYTTSSGVEAGVEVTNVEPNSAAAQRGMLVGDIITAVNRRAVRNVAQFREMAGDNRILFLLVRRDGRELMLQIR